MQICHEGEVLVKRTMKTANGVTFINFPSYTCYCGQSEPHFLMGDLELADRIAQRTLSYSVNPEAITVDFDKLSPALVEMIRQEIAENWDEFIQKNPPQVRRPKASLEDIEKELIARYATSDTVSCRELTHP